MKTLGLIGGMSWESTALYYRLLNEGTRALLGGLHSAELLLWSFDFDDIETLQRQDDWDTAERRLTAAAMALANAGADALLICTNTMHRVADAVESASGLPLIHIADATARAIKKSGLERPLLLGTRYTMEQSFYRGRLRDLHGITVLTPDPEARVDVNDIIYQELCVGDIRPASRARYLEIIDSARKDGADSIILGCTEIGLLLSDHHTDLPLLDSTRIHVQAALEHALA